MKQTKFAFDKTENVRELNKTISETQLIREQQFVYTLLLISQAVFLS